MERTEAWSRIDLERHTLADQLASLDPEQWQTASLCTGLTVREVLAHLTVSGSLSPARWFAGVLRARFDFDKQVDQRLREELGDNPAKTLQRFRATVTSRTAPPLPKLALLGEMVVHGEDIRRPLGLVREHPRSTLRAVLQYYAGTDQVVLARGRIKGLQLKATDDDFSTGHGDLVRGSSLALVMAMTGRKAYCAELDGPGVAALADRS
jgi:uncharacterized protein (TIGR03083 family)